MTAHIIHFPREATALRFKSVRGNIYDQAYEAVKTATDWPTKLGLAAKLEDSPDWTHKVMARHLRTAHSLHLEGLLKPVDPAHRDRSDMVDGWRAAAIQVEAEETPVRIAMRYRPQLLAWLTGGLLAALAAVAFGVVVLPAIGN